MVSNGWLDDLLSLVNDLLFQTCVHVTWYAYILTLWVAKQTQLSTDFFQTHHYRIQHNSSCYRKYKKLHSFNAQQVDWLEERQPKTSQVYVIALHAGMFEMRHLIRSCLSGRAWQPEHDNYFLLATDFIFPAIFSLIEKAFFSTEQVY